MKFTSLKHFEFVEIDVLGAARVWECGDIKIHEQIMPGVRDFLASRDNVEQYIPGHGLIVGRVWLMDANGDTMRFKTPQEAAEEALKQWI
jgi:hypothetical protein